MRPGSRSRSRPELSTASNPRGGARRPGATSARSPEAAAYEREFPGARYLAARALRQLEVTGMKVESVIAAVARRYGLSHAALNALAVIEGAGRPIPTGEVTAQMHITTATMTSVLDTLERSGYVVRSADPSDRRRVLVDVTPAACDVLDQMLPAVAQTAAAAMAGLDDDALHQLMALLDAVTEGVANLPDDLPEPPARRRPKALRRA